MKTQQEILIEVIEKQIEAMIMLNQAIEICTPNSDANSLQERANNILENCKVILKEEYPKTSGFSQVSTITPSRIRVIEKSIEEYQVEDKENSDFNKDVIRFEKQKAFETGALWMKKMLIAN